MTNNKLRPASSQFILYQDDNDITNVNVRFDGKDVWLSQQQIAILFDTTQQNVSLHINSILDEAELLQEATHKYFLLVRQKGNWSVKRQIEHYNPDMIIAIGYRVKSQAVTRFEELLSIKQLPMSMQQWIERLDTILSVGNLPLHKNTGKISHEQTIEKATHEFEEYRRKEMLQYKSDFDRAINELRRKRQMVQRQCTATLEMANGLLADSNFLAYQMCISFKKLKYLYNEK
jgi:hypothetical protein